jgi:hypothetical protein
LKQPRACSSALAAAAAWPPMSERAIGGNGGGKGLVQPGSTCAAQFSLFPCFL